MPNAAKLAFTLGARYAFALAGNPSHAGLHVRRVGQRNAGSDHNVRPVFGHGIDAPIIASYAASAGYATYQDVLDDGMPVVIVESMKMEIPVESPASGTVTELLVAEGDSVADGQWLVRLD